MALEAVVFAQDPLINSTPSFNCIYPISNSSMSMSNNININSCNNFGTSYEFANYYNYTSKFEDTLKSPCNIGLFEPNNDTNNNNNHNNILNNFCDFSPTSELLNLDESNSNLSQWGQNHNNQYVSLNYSSPEDSLYPSSEAAPPNATTSSVVVGGGARRKRRRRSCKNKEEVEHQRMTHIAVERNRRKQMNEYLAVIRSLMPPYYVQRGDQASIVGGAINYVKELEQLLQSMEGQKTSNKHRRQKNHHHKNPPSPPQSGGGGGSGDNGGSDSQESMNNPCLETNKSWPPLLFADFFSFPQYSTRCKANSEGQASGSELGGSNSVSSINSGVGEIEVTMVESHANVKILAKKNTKQLVKLIAGFQGLRLNVLHLNVTTVDSFVFYSLSLKVEEGCQLNSVDDIAAATNHILGQIQKEAANHII